jgi:hypothetical protein
MIRRTDTIMRRFGATAARWARSEIGRGVMLGAAVGLAIVIAFHTGRVAFQPQPPPQLHTARTQQLVAVDDGASSPMSDVHALTQWIIKTGDARGMGFVIIDKKDAKLYIFDATGRLRAATPVLLGGARGDDSVQGIGERLLADVKPEDRTTPAGRFVGERGHNARGEDVVWVDYEAGVSMHRVLTTDPAEKRLERLATPTSDDNRISYGCINIPTQFYEEFVRPMFAGQTAPIYVLPETRSLAEVFFDRRLASTAQPEGR